MQVTQKKKTLSFKQLDATIQTTNDKGEVESHSHKCTEMTKLVPELMGVSRSILDNVIFCHQEDVNWPLSTSSILKAKFDAIFSSTRYTKAIDNIKSISKKTNLTIKDINAELQVAENNLKHATKLEREKEEINYKIEELQKDREKAEKKLKKCQQQLDKLEEKEKEIRELKAQIQKHEGEYYQLEKQIKQKENSMENVFEESEEEFKEMVQKFDLQVEVMRKEVEKLTQEKESLKVNKKELTNLIKEVTKQKISLQAKKEQQEERKRNIKEQMEKLKDQFNIMNDEENPTLEAIKLFSNQLDERIKEQLSEIKQRKEESEKEYNNSKSELHTCKVNMEHQNTKKLEIEEKSRELENTKGEIEDYLKQLNIGDPNEKTIKQNEIEKVRENINNLEGTLDLATLSKKIEVNQEFIKVNSIKRETLRSQIAKKEAEKESHIKMEQLQKDCTDMKHQNEEILLEIQNELETLNEQKPQHVEDIENRIRELKENHQSKLETIQNEVDSLQSKLHKLQYQLETENNKLKENQKTIESNSHQLKNSSFSTSTIVKEIEKMKDDLNKAQTEYKRTQILTECFMQFIEQSKENNMCPVCYRDFNEERELEDFIETNQDKINRTPEIIAEKKHHVDHVESQLSQLGALKPIIDENEKLTVAMKEINEKIDSFKEAIANLEAKIETKLIESEKKEQKIKTIDALMEQSKTVSRNLNHMNSKQQEIQSIQSSIQTNANGESYNSLKEQLNHVESELDKRQQEIQSLLNQRSEGENQLVQLRGKLQELTTQFNELEKALLRAENKRNELIRVQKEIETSQISLSEKNHAVEELTKQMDHLRTIHSNHEETLKRITTEFEKTSFELHSSSQTFKSIYKQILDDEAHSIEDELKKIIAQEHQQNAKLDNIIQKDEELEKSIESERTRLSKEEMIRNSIFQNIELRSLKREFDQTSALMKKLKNELDSTTDGQMVDDDAIDQLRATHASLSQKISQTDGRLSSHHERVYQMNKELRGEDYKNVHKIYRAALIKMQTQKFALGDLDKYRRALEKALLQYHTMKMNEINDIIKDLWQKTYRGQDIDSIAIRAQAGKSARSSYDYRLVMIKNGIELDMRGRCSAGQKVLASLIIRLALAEAFCIDCGVLALDEPTTNLDMENINSLAEALHVIIRERKHQQNFQLIVITHDEEFVQRIGQNGDLVEYYYRVNKDPLSLCSVIERQHFRGTFV